MNILITAPNLNPSKNVSGISSVVNTIITHNLSHEYFHYLLGRPDGDLNKITRVLLIMKQIFCFPFAIIRNKIEIVHQNLPYNSKGLIREFIINLFCRLLRTKIIVHVHGGEFLMNGTPNRLYYFIAKSIFFNCDSIIVLSELERNAINEQFHLEEVHVLNNCVDTNTYTFSSTKSTSDKPIILFLGRIHESKGLEDIIEAFKILQKKIGFKFILCGAGPLQKDVIDSCTNLLKNDFEYKGIVSGDEKIEIIKMSNYFILPSRYGEGLPIALLETMALGVVPIVTEDASMKYVVRHMFNGAKVAKYAPADIASKILEIQLNSELYQTLSINAASEIAKNYNIETYIQKLNGIYDHLNSI